eukprot:scaffold93016_cov66-Phaeocystis_antarctica.AAC.2
MDDRCRPSRRGSGDRLSPEAPPMPSRSWTCSSTRATVHVHDTAPVFVVPLRSDPRLGTGSDLGSGSGSCSGSGLGSCSGMSLGLGSGLGSADGAVGGVPWWGGKAGDRCRSKLQSCIRARHTANPSNPPPPIQSIHGAASASSSDSAASAALSH